MARFLQLLVFGLQLGSIYALLAIGYTMVFGIIRMINMMHGDFLMIGSYAVYFAVSLLFGNQLIGPAAALLVLMISGTVTGSIGVGIERFAYRPLRSRAPISSMISAIGVGLFVENLFRIIPFIGPNPRTAPKLMADKIITVGGVDLNIVSIVVILFSLVIMGILYYVIQNTKIGMQMRAVACDKDASALMGSTLGNKAFISAVVGGIGDIRGAVLGGFIMGIVEILVSSVLPDLAYGISFIVLVIILLFKPEGLLGKPQIEKV